jgi:bile acid-coenzyme A ligase
VAVTISIGQRVRELAEEQPDELVYRHAALDGAEPAFTWPELHRRSSQLAGELAARGVGHGDRLAIGIRNSPQFVFGALAAWKLGATPVPVRWDLPDWELERVRAVVDAKVHLGAEDLGWIDASASAPAPELPDAIAPSMYGICSSGATGTPKVIINRAPAVYDDRGRVPWAARWQPVTLPQRILVPAPMYHTNGFTVLARLLAGDHLVVLEKFDAARVVDLIERYRITTFTATPTMLLRIAALPGIDDRDLSSIEWFLQGAAPMPPSLVARWAELVGEDKIFMAYGSSESLGVTMLRGDEYRAHPGSVGRPLQTEIRILDDGGTELPTGEIGEVYLRSTLLVGSYYLGAEPLAATDDGFRSVGDLGYVDEDGYLYLVDRRVDLIISGGANVYPAEVETALIDHPKVADVVVIGLQDPEWGRRVHAVIQATDPSDPPTMDDIRTHAKSRLAAYKVPKTIELVDAIPRSEATKVSRRAMIEARGG